MTSIFSADIVEAIGIGLTNSIWFGLFGYAALRILNAVIGEDKPEVRYFVSSSIMFIVLFLTFFTIFHFTDGDNYISANGQEYLRIDYSSSQNISGIPAFLQLQFFTQLLISLNEIVILNITPILIAWITGILLLSMRYFLAFRDLIQIISSASTISNSRLEIIVGKIRSAVGISRKIKVAESRLITVPSVIGILKPVVLLPAGIISSLPAEQIELILAHEFAHIKRLDPVFRFLQSIIEILFFFNPFIWLISKTIDSEREKCCDDSALRICDNKLALAKALHHIAEYNLQRSIALSFSGKSAGIIPRIRRILKPEMNSTGSTAGPVLAFAATIIFSLILISVSPGTHIDNQKRGTVNQANVYGLINNGDEIINILENKFGQSVSVGETDPNSISGFNTDIHSKENESITNVGTVEEGLADRINVLFGDESKFQNIMEDFDINFADFEQFYRPEFAEKFDFAKSIDLDFDFEQDLDITDLKYQIAEIQNNIKKLKQN